MKTILKPTHAFLLAAIAIAAPTHALASVYLRPGVSLNKTKITYSAPGDPSESWSGNKAGFNLAGGFTFGENDSHDFGVSFGSSKFTDTNTLSSSGTVESTQLTSTLTPLLFTYRYTFGAAAAPLRFYVGPALGWLSLKIDGVYTFRSGSFVYNEPFGEKERAFAHGGHAGLVWKFAENWRLDLGLSHTMSKVDFPFDDEPGGYEMKVNTLALTAGAIFTF